MLQSTLSEADLQAYLGELLGQLTDGTIQVSLANNLLSTIIVPTPPETCGTLQEPLTNIVNELLDALVSQFGRSFSFVSLQCNVAALIAPPSPPLSPPLPSLPPVPLPPPPSAPPGSERSEYLVLELTVGPSSAVAEERRERRALQSTLSQVSLQSYLGELLGQLTDGAIQVSLVYDAVSARVEAAPPSTCVSLWQPLDNLIGEALQALTTLFARNFTFVSLQCEVEVHTISPSRPPQSPPPLSPPQPPPPPAPVRPADAFRVLAIDTGAGNVTLQVLWHTRFSQRECM